jgi:hypothetical protein
MTLRRLDRCTGLVVLLLSYTCGMATAHAEYDDGSGPCVQTTRVVGDLFKTPWAITPRDVQNTALGTHRMPLKWRHEEAISYGMEGTSTTLLVEITRRKGPVTFVERGRSQWDSLAIRAATMVYDCSSKLRIPVHVKATTQDGVVSVEGDSELAVSSRNSIIMTLYAAQRGTLRIRELREKGTVVDSFGIVLGFRRKRTMVGAIGGSYRCTADNCLHMPYAYACFPDNPPFQVDEFILGACR